jgi:hypothetical protein
MHVRRHEFLRRAAPWEKLPFPNMIFDGTIIRPFLNHFVVFLLLLSDSSRIPISGMAHTRHLDRSVDTTISSFQVES